MNKTARQQARTEQSEAFKRRVDAAYRVLLIAGLGMQPETNEPYAATTGELLGWLRTDTPALATQIDEARNVVLRPYYDARLAAMFGGMS